MSNLSASSLLAGSWVNMLLYGTELVLGGFYLINARSNVFFRWTLASSLCIDTICTAVVCYNVYLYLILEPQALTSNVQPWTLPATILCTYHAALVEQVFFTCRYWQITRNKLVTLLIVTITASHVAFAWVLGVGLIINPVVSQSGLNLTIVAATLCAATDLLIAITTFHTMRAIKTTFSATQSLLRRISIQSVACGSTTSIFTIIMVSLLVTHNLEPFTVIFDILGRLYTLTILINYICLRKPLAHATNTSEGSSPGGRREREHSIAFGAAHPPRSFTVPVELSTIDELHSIHSIHDLRNPPSPKINTETDSFNAFSRPQKSYSKTFLRHSSSIEYFSAS
ncbi:hypothetical protein EV361DRAFT_892743 [Lentinula raphanica]|uniref:Uncharacterized protein n=1 Tax=Lentinula raphanica TaxID=153919 RepID=A0AA38PBX7_9AGAR|nr:hypothetical protein F5878DRAFT_87972 [Lentinula raphanica]KAJ3974783.1 hypothetical protein EV361DRAFT_892743 [Lentinula raphanica]